MHIPFQKIVILGPGLLGGSVALAAREQGIDTILWGRNPERVQATCALGLTATTDLAEALSGARLVIFAVPVGVMDQLADAVKSHLHPDALVTDVGSVKVLPHQVARAHELPFIGSHPMAGSEQSGIEAANADLLQDASCVLTNEDQLSTDTLQQFWLSLGCHHVEVMTAVAHDEAVARISHFPHAMSSLTADIATKTPHLHLAGGGFRDTTRVASGDPAMWAEIMIENKHALSVSLLEAREQIGKMLDHLINSDQEGLEQYLADIKFRKGQSDVS